MALRLLWHQQDNPTSRGAKRPSDQAIPGQCPWLGAEALMAQLPKLLSAFQVPSPALLSTLGTIAPDNNLCHLQKPEVFLLFPPNSRWKAISVVDSGQAPGFPEDREQWPLSTFLLS